jgi:hypothetical protein
MEPPIGFEPMTGEIRESYFEWEWSSIDLLLSLFKWSHQSGLNR